MTNSSPPTTPWEQRFLWEEQVLFPAFERLAGRNAGSLVRMLEKEHASLRRHPRKTGPRFLELLKEIQHRTEVVYSFVKDCAAREGVSFERLLAGKPKQPRPPRRVESHQAQQLQQAG